MLNAELENVLEADTIQSSCFLAQRCCSIGTQHRSLNPRANNASQLQLDASDKQHVVGILVGDKGS